MLSTQPTCPVYLYCTSYNCLWWQTVKRIVWSPIKFRNDTQHNSKMGAIKLREPRKAQHLQLCNFVHSACKFVFLALMQQYQEMNLVKLSMTCGRILRMGGLSCIGMLRIYGFMTGLFLIWWLDCLFHCSFRVLIHVFRDCERFSLLLGLQHLLREVFAYFR